ncbi:AfsR/SARP family transcriptional regulator [Streptomyces sp. NBC_01264]|uniref:AfsR/SARP family transcriptional regulator n=1 Tax=Streptomyces sp. NBC_01264 TaxID=2903804 RepID=UPI002255B985|nr:AfsR/SARP family transcriptional regulator [Streptomyces sp. NBC_01264]MCX4778463.1 AfsR/SARP family transcriptional regulator [Streptomyces sp. NBC_01264]
MLALLASASPAIVSNAALVGEIWTRGSPEKTDNALHALMSRLRRDLDSACGAGFANARVVTGRPGYGLRLGENEVDSHLFDRLCAEARAVSGEEALVLYDRALSLWRGPALGGVSDGAWLRGVQARLEESRLAATSEKINIQLVLGHHAQVLCELQELTALYPVHEDYSRQLMIALYRAGRQTEALTEYARIRRALREGQGVEPSPLLRECLTAVLRHDIPSADARVPASAA